LVKRKEVRIEYYHTDEMRADFLTKPLVGNVWKRQEEYHE